jgi:hypothetical protein
LLNIAPTYPTFNAAVKTAPQAGWFNLRDTNQDILTAIPALEAGATLAQSGPLVPPDVGTFQIADGWNVRADFIEFGNIVPVFPTKVSNLRLTLNSSSALTVPTGTLGGIALNQGLLMIISSASNLTAATRTALTAAGWTVYASEPADTTYPRLYICGKYAIASEPDLSLVHVVGKMTVDISNWINVDPVNLFDAAPVFDQPANTSPTSPSATPTRANCEAFSVLTDVFNPVYSATPAPLSVTWALLQQGFVSSVYWTGVAYRKRLDASATGVLTWGLTNTTGTRNSATFFLRNAAGGITKQAFTVPLVYNSASKPNYPINLTVNP